MMMRANPHYIRARRMFAAAFAFRCIRRLIRGR